MIPRRAPDPEPVPQCGATFNEHRCTLDKDHEGWHQEWVERLVDTATWQDAPEVPKWRVLANAGVRSLTSEDPLTVVLRSLANVADPNKVTSANLARIIAVAEREVGDGWQVEPDLIRMCHPDRRDRCDLDCLIDALTKDGESRWTVLGGRTAAWLKAITEDEAS